MFGRESSPSSSDNEKKGDTQVERRASVASRVESLHELPDPDAGKSPEERAKIVCWSSPRMADLLLTIIAGQSSAVEGRSLDHPMALFALSALLPRSIQHRQCSCCRHGKRPLHGRARLQQYLNHFLYFLRFGRASHQRLAQTNDAKNLLHQHYSALGINHDYDGIGNQLCRPFGM